MELNYRKRCSSIASFAVSVSIISLFYFGHLVKQYDDKYIVLRQNSSFDLVTHYQGALLRSKIGVKKTTLGSFENKYFNSSLGDTTSHRMIVIDITNTSQNQNWSTHVLEKKDRTKLRLNYHYDQEWLTGWADVIDSQVTRLPPNPALNQTIEEQQAVCEPMADWQTQPRQTCNTFHEMNLIESLKLQQINKMGNGFWRLGYQLDGLTNTNFTDASRSESTPKSILLKVLRYNFIDFNDVTTQRSLIDGLVSMSVSTSKNAVNTYGFCAHSSMFEIASNGDLYNYICENHSAISSEQKLRMALDMARGIADVHGIDYSGNSTKANQAKVVIMDVKPGNMLLMDDMRVKVNDFNNAELLQWNTTSQSPCNFRCKNGMSAYRSPEEAREEPLSEKVDIYSLGSVLFFVLTGKDPYFMEVGDYWTTSHYKSKVSSRERHCQSPQIPQWYLRSTNQFLQAIVSAIQRCHACDPTLRPSAHELANEFSTILSRAPNKDFSY